MIITYDYSIQNVFTISANVTNKIVPVVNIGTSNDIVATSNDVTSILNGAYSSYSSNTSYISGSSSFNQALTNTTISLTQSTINNFIAGVNNLVQTLSITLPEGTLNTLTELYKTNLVSYFNGFMNEIVFETEEQTDEFISYANTQFYSFIDSYISNTITPQLNTVLTQNIVKSLQNNMNNALNNALINLNNNSLIVTLQSANAFTTSSENSTKYNNMITGEIQTVFNEFVANSISESVLTVENYINQVSWVKIGTDQESGNTGYVVGTTEFTNTNKVNANIIPFNDLSKETVVNWIEQNSNPLTIINQNNNILFQILSKSGNEVEQHDIPWNN